MNQSTPPDDPSASTEAADATEATTPEPAPADHSPESPVDRPAEADTPDRSPVSDAPPVPTPRGGRAVAALALLIALAAGAGSAYVFWITQLASKQADNVRADVSGDISAVARKTSTLEDQIRAIQTDKLTLDSQLEELRTAGDGTARRLADLESRTARLAQRENGPTAIDWRLAEVESLLRIANQQATLARDPNTALAALVAADSLLNRMSDPSVQQVRTQIADDILSLQSVPRPDVEGIALRLGSLARRVDALPLAGQHRGDVRPPSADEAAGGLARLSAKIADFFGSIFRVRRTEGSEEPLLSPEESFFLRRNLELELQTARLALLEADASVYRASLNSGRRWTEEYFQTDDPGVQAFITALGELESRRIEIEIPDISGSLKTLLATEADRIQ